MSTVRDARDRLLEMCEAIVLPAPLGTPHAFEDESECSFAPDQLPAFVVMPATDQTYTHIDYNTYFTTQEFIILLYVSEICDESYQSNVEAWDLAEDCREVVADYFHIHEGLEFEDAGILENTRVTRSRRMTLETRGNESKYHGAMFRLSTNFTRANRP